MKVVFRFHGTFRWVTFEKLMMKNDFFYSAKSFNHPVQYCAKIIVKMEDFLHNIIHPKQLSRLKKIMHFHH